MPNTYCCCWRVCGALHAEMRLRVVGHYFVFAPRLLFLAAICSFVVMSMFFSSKELRILSCGRVTHERHHHFVHLEL